MKRKFFRIFAIVLFSLFVIIQFVPSSLPETTSDNTADIIQNGFVGKEVAVVLKTSCYDCHSTQTIYPWYSHVAPVSWLVKHDIEEGREELNFSEWKNYTKRKTLKKLDEIGEVLEEGEMPLPIYTIMHRNAKLSQEQKNLIIQWAKEESNRIVDN